MRLVALIIVATASQLLGVHAFAVPGGAAVSLTLRRPTQASGFKGGASIPFRVRSREQPVGGLRMVLGPVGPFSPFRSAYISSNAVDRDMQKLVGLQMESAKKMQSLQENGGDAPNKDDVRRLAAELEETNEQWLYMLTRFRLVEDFQALQLFKLTETHLKSFGFSFDLMHKNMAWQITAMKSYADDTPPPEIPKELEEAMAKQAPPGAALTSMFPSAQGVSAIPFLPESLGSDVVKKELDTLVNDNRMIVKMGEKYGSFDGGGKRIYIEQLEAVEARWDVFLKRFELMGTINPEFVSQTQGYLKSMQMGGEDQFREVLLETRTRIKADTEST